MAGRDSGVDIKGGWEWTLGMGGNEDTGVAYAIT